MADLTRRGLIAGGVLAGGALLSASNAGGHQSNGGHAGHTGSGHANFRNHVAVDHVANGFDPHELLLRLRLGHDAPAAERARAARMEAGRDRQGDRGHAGREVRRLDLQRADPGPDLALPRGRAAADHVQQRLRAPAHDPLPRHPPGRDGRRARDRRRADRPGQEHGLRVRRAARGPAPLPLPRAAAGRAHRQGPLRRVHRRPGGRARGRERDGHGDERVRHQLRPRQRGLRRQHRRLRLHGPADPGQARTSSSGSTSSTCSSTT